MSDIGRDLGVKHGTFFACHFKIGITSTKRDLMHTLEHFYYVQ